MSELDISSDFNFSKESPSGSVCESLNSDQVQEILEKLSISEIDTADSFNLSNKGDSSESEKSSKQGEVDTKDDAISEESSEKDGVENESKEEKDIENNYVNSNEDKGKGKGSKGNEKVLRRKSKSDESPKNGSEKKKKRPFSFFRRSISKDSTEKEPPPSPFAGIMKIRVESLPQVFITKYLGCRPCTGIWGTEHTVKPVKEMIDAAKKLGVGKDLSLVRIKVTDKGLEVNTHKENKGPEIESGLIPVEFISYGVQDFTFTRVFSFIMVREMSYKAKKMECHAYVCPSTLNARKLSLSVALSFKEYAKSLDGKQFRFQVELGQKSVIDDRLPDNPTEANPEEDEEEC